MTLILSHLVSLGVIGRVCGRVGWTVGREGWIYRHGVVRLDIGGSGGTARGQERTCCLSHTGRRATRLGVGGVGGRAREIFLVSGRARRRRRRVQAVVRLGGVGRRNIGGSSVRLRGVLRVRAHLWLRGVGVGVVSRGSSRGLVCGGRGGRFRRCVGDGRWVVRT